jgi:chromosomal replication initiation ATPase DnaA
MSKRKEERICENENCKEKLVLCSSMGRPKRFCERCAKERKMVQDRKRMEKTRKKNGLINKIKETDTENLKIILEQYIHDNPIFVSKYGLNYFDTDNYPYGSISTSYSAFSQRKITKDEIIEIIRDELRKLFEAGSQLKFKKD